MQVCGQENKSQKLLHFDIGRDLMKRLVSWVKFESVPTESARWRVVFLCVLCEVMEVYEVENTVKQLCAEASATQRDPRKFKNVLIQLREFMREHIEVIRSMSPDTYRELRKVWHL